MNLRRELWLSIGVLIALNLLLAFGAIGLFVRMGPAIERILEENVFSITAAEVILVEMADSRGRPMLPVQRARVAAALEDARQNITEQEERVVLGQVEAHLSRTFDGDAEARAQTIDALRELMSINRLAMHRADAEAGRLGRAGAWAAVFVGLASFWLSIVVVVRLQNRVVRPLIELNDVLQAAARGERMRRCKPYDAPSEVDQVSAAVNRLLDERLRTQRHTTKAADE